MAGLFHRKAPGRQPKLSAGEMAALPFDKLRSAGVRRSRSGGGWGRAVAGRRSVPVAGHWEVHHSETGMLRLLWALDLSYRKTRPRHPKSDVKVQHAFKKGGFAATVTEIAAAHPEATRFEVRSQDEARVGQQGRTGYVWWQRS